MTAFAKLIVTLHWTQPTGSVVFDDLVIVPSAQESTHYDVSFLQRTVQNKTTLLMKKEDLYNYLAIFFSTILADTNQPRWIQIDTPLYPSVLLPPHGLLTYGPLLSDQLTTLQTEWPCETLLKDAAV